MTEKCRGFFKNLQKPDFLNNKENKEEKSPENKVPACTVPETRQKPYNKKVSVGFEFTLSVAAKGNVNIISEKRA